MFFSNLVFFFVVAVSLKITTFCLNYLLSEVTGQKLFTKSQIMNHFLSLVVLHEEFH